MTEPKAYVFTDTELKALGIDPGNKVDLVAETRQMLDGLATRPAMYVGRADDLSGILHLSREYMSNLAYYYGSLSLGKFWDTCKFGSIGNGRLLYEGEWPNQTKRTTEQFMVAFREHIQKFYTWLPDNKILLEVEIPLDGLVFQNHHIPDEDIKNHPAVLEAKKKIEMALKTINANMTYVFAEGPSFCAAWKDPKVHITALYRPVNPESYGREKAIKFGFVD